MAEVRKNEISLEAFFYLSGDYMFVLNKEGVIMKMNQPFKQLLGIEDEQEHQINFYDLVYFEDVRYIIITLGNCIKEGYNEK
ncbi:MAG: hypothetical protein H7259_09960, partial [Cytophagales bacterium]|nr:hypothetical protein [Cytophaga sp.]